MPAFAPVAGAVPKASDAILSGPEMRHIKLKFIHTAPMRQVSVLAHAAVFVGNGVTSDRSLLPLKEGWPHIGRRCHQQYLPVSGATDFAWLAL